jgi:hypothetical protein
MAKQAKPRRYAREREWYEKKLKKIMEEFGAGWTLRYDRWEGAALDFTYKGVTRRFERVIDNQNIHFASDCLAQIALGMEKLLWLKREGIFDLDVLAAGLPELPAPMPEWCRTMGLNRIPDSLDELEARYRQRMKIVHPDAGGTNEAFRQLQAAKAEAESYFAGVRT